MPFKNVEITPVKYTETQRNTRYQLYKGFSTLDPSNTSSKLFDFDLIKQDIINHFNTRKGERVMNPTFGSIIWDLIMEPLTEDVRNLLSNDIVTICKFDPRVIPLDIKVNEYEQGYLVEISLQMKDTDETSTLRLAFDQQIGLVVQ
jgi:phage baseplate assembly protein W